MRVVLDALDVRSGHGTVERSETTLEQAGACVIAISTALPERGVVLNSAYLADLAETPLAASHILTAPDRVPGMWQRIIDDKLGLSLMRACLLDHTVALHGGLQRLWGVPVTVEVSDRALEQGTEFRARPSNPRL